jgi:uncharacterized protein (DUF427 family)
MAVVDERPVKEPGPGHPITIEPAGRRIRVTVAGRVVAESERALTLREAGYAPVHYFPPEDVDFTLLEPTDHTSWCPYKGEADYHSVPAGDERSVNAAWRYRTAFPAVAAIAGHIAFYRDRVDISA